MYICQVVIYIIKGKKEMLKNIFTIITLLFITSCAGAKIGGGGVNTHKVDGVRNVAIKGYDPVAYFRSLKPIKGSSEHSLKWNGATWFFVSEQNKQSFEINPERYAPQYGGYCAYGISVPERKIDIDPQAWNIHKGKLYLNYTPNTQDIWKENKEDHIEAADKNWPRIR